MGDQNYYEKLGVSEDATFDEIQEARNRLLQQYSGDYKHLEAVETAYDAILMERLRMRQEGKIKVPEGIRFAERLAQVPPKENSPPVQKSPEWLQRLVDQPSLTDIILPATVFLGLSALSIVYTAASAQILQMALIVGVGTSFFFLYRKEKKFGRAVLLTGMGLVTGLIAGGIVGSVFLSQLSSLGISVEQFSTTLTFILLWVISSFLR
ncbi:CPP1-like family protein [Gloeocapsopsis dulcis]|uniref:Molecular chaperone DnaJ n=1 Tax=Gloeocapsopsis dulcis AAB1 = 1H9 TaxID=1433147 RepID=A0A6N8FVT7_9CHRO|nr:CPP1-like family protein [Gloeocapsopsis dulcis]MUL37238.1 molecular chaperone DnaJ [Gloeocapsopsis dulcis AAB1 = 1H9]WNN90151.1 CPP1-like family protein [Gloeocapsopsis dulcis]